MRVVVLGQRRGWHTESLLAALERRGVAAECCAVTQLTARVGGLPLLTAAGVPLMCDEPGGFRTFRVGLFGLDKWADVEGTVGHLARALDVIRAQPL